MAIAFAAPSGPVFETMPPDAILLKKGANYQSIVDSAPAGATFWFDSGVHRLSAPIDPKDNQTFMGNGTAVLDGSRVLTDFTQEGSNFVASGQTQQGIRNATDEGAKGAERPGYPETFFIDGKPLTAVDRIAHLQPGKFFFDYEANKIYFRDNPTGHTVEAGLSPAAFDSDSSGVKVSNLIVQHFNAPVQAGAIDGGENWTIQNNEVRLNYGIGVKAKGGSQIVGNDIHDNGQMGIGAVGRDIVVKGNEIHVNGFWSGIDPFWEGGGTKFALTENLVVRDNYSHGNNGFGLWTDINNINTLYEGNLVVDNSGGGINHEISYDAVIRNNVLIGNGEDAQPWLWGSQIQLQNSRNVEVYGNKIDMSGGVNGIGLIQQDRGSGTHGEYTTTGNKIHDNVLVSTGGDGKTGGVADHDEAGLLNGGNAFSRNTYYMDGGDHWWWGDFKSGDSWAAYQSDTNQDANSTLSSAIPNISAWINGSNPTPRPTPRPSEHDTGQETAGPNPVGSNVPPQPAKPSQEADGGNLSPAPMPATPVPVPSKGPDLRGSNRGDVLDGSPSSEKIYGMSGNDKINGLAGNDKIFAGKGSDVLDGGAGDDSLFGGRGSDRFVFTNKSGIDSIEDFALRGRSQDIVVVSRDMFASFDAIMKSAHMVGADTVIDFGNSHLVLDHIKIADLTRSDFLFI